MADLAATSGIDEAFDLSGRVAVLTGAASGIGRSTAQVLSAAGATVVLGDIDALVDRAAGDYGRVDIMGNIAGIPHNQMSTRPTRTSSASSPSISRACSTAARPRCGS